MVISELEVEMDYLRRAKRYFHIFLSCFLAKMVMQGLRYWIASVCDGAVCRLDGWVVFHF